MGELKAPDKPFDISKRAVWEAYEKVRANKGAPGVDKVSLADFEKDLKNNLYKIWNRMSSGSYFPPPVRAVEIPKPHGGGTRTLGVPTVADRIAQTVVAGVLERASEPVFHPDSHGYRPGRSAIDAVAACRERCWRHDACGCRELGHLMRPAGTRGRGRRAGPVGARGWPPRNVAGCRLRAGAGPGIGEVGGC